jgi:hypothetical protein
MKETEPMTIEELIAYVEADPMRQANTDAHDAVIAALYLAREASRRVETSADLTLGRTSEAHERRSAKKPPCKHCGKRAWEHATVDGVGYVCPQAVFTYEPDLGTHQEHCPAGKVLGATCECGP